LPGVVTMAARAREEMVGAGRAAEAGEGAEAGEAVPPAPGGEDADHYRVQTEHDVDAGQQGGLVVGAERGDREVLDGRRGQADGGLADGVDRGAAQRAEAGGKLADADGDQAGQQSGRSAEQRP